MGTYKRVIMVVISGLGIGPAPDARKFMDQGADTVGDLTAHFRARLQLPNLGRLGLARLHPLYQAAAEALDHTQQWRVRPRAVGKSKLEGYWELLGVPTTTELTALPRGLAPELIQEIARFAGRPVLVNRPYSRPRLLFDWGATAVAAGAILAATSGGADLVLTAHENLVPPTQLDRVGHFARALLDRQADLQIGQVVTVPFTGRTPADFAYRLVDQHEYNMAVPRATLLDQLRAAGVPVNTDPQVLTEDGLQFFRLGKAATAGCHRDPEKMGQALMAADARLGEIISQVTNQDLLVVTADYGAAPDFPGDGLTREWLPLLFYSPAGVAWQRRPVVLGDVAEIIKGSLGLK